MEFFHLDLPIGCNFRYEGVGAGGGGQEQALQGFVRLQHPGGSGCRPVGLRQDRLPGSFVGERTGGDKAPPGDQPRWLSEGILCFCVLSG